MTTAPVRNAGGSANAVAERDRHEPETPQYHVAIVGTGFAGLGTAIQLQRRGWEDYVVLEKAEDVGGTWRDNTYPGCACDVPSNLYSFSFAPNPGWSHSFSPQPEIFGYLRQVAREGGVTERIRFGHEVLSAEWDEEGALWRIETSKGQVTARVLVSGMGALHEPSIPRIPGLDTFKGTIFHSAQWRHDHDLRGERVAVVGTGASAIQFIPKIQPEAKQLVVFQRTPAWVVPRMDRAFASWERRMFQRFPAIQRLARAGIYGARELMVPAMTRFPGLMKGVQRLAQKNLERQVRDPELRRKLMPDYRLGCKRILLASDYYPALTKPNVDVVTEGIREIREHSVVDTAGNEHEVDTIIFGTGFKVTDAPAAQMVRGRDGVLLADAWREGMSAYVGTTIAGFPNFFMLVGPNTGLGHSSMVYMIESQINYVMDCLRYMRAERAVAVDVKSEVQKQFVERVHRRMRHTVWLNGGCASWYLDEHGRNTTLWPTFTFTFRNMTRRFDPESYRVRRRAARPATAPA